MPKLLRRLNATHLIILALYTILTIVLTWPLTANFTTHVPGTAQWAFDEYTFVWNLWWFKHALFDLGTNPLASNFIFYPVGTSLVLYTYNIFNAIAALALEPIFGLIVTSNLLIVAAFVLSAYGTFLLVHYLLYKSQVANRKSQIPSLAAFIAGLVYAFTSSKFVYAALGHYDMVSTEWIPFFALFFIKTVHEQDLRNAILAGIFATLALLNEMIFGIFLAFLAIIYLAFLGRQLFDRELAKRLAILLVTLVILYSPLLVPILTEMLGSDYALTGWGDAPKLSVDLVGLVTPTALHPLWGTNWLEEITHVKEGTARFTDVNTLFVGWIVLALAVFAAIRFWPQVKAWATSAVVFALFALGPLLHINGRSVFNLDGLDVTVPLPFILLHYLPIVRTNRVPNRFSVVLILCLAVLAGYAAAWLLSLASRKLQGTSLKSHLVVALLLSILLMVEHISVPLPLTDARVPDVYRQIAADPGDFAILDIPLGWRNSFSVLGAERTQAQYYQSVHGKRLLSGNISRNPPFQFDYFARAPIVRSIIALETYQDVPAEQIARDQEQVAEFIRFFDIRYVVVQPAIPGRLPYADTRPKVLAYIEQVFPLEKFYDRNGLVAYRVSVPQASAKFNIDFGAEAALLYRGDGWDRDEEIAGASANWATAQGTRIFLPVHEINDYRLTIAAIPFSYPGSPPQSIELRVNERAVQTFTLAPAWTPYTVDVPANALHRGVNEVTLNFAYLASPHVVLPGDFAIGSTGTKAPLDLTVRAVGAGEYTTIRVGQNDAAPHRRGYNVVVIDPQSGRVLTAKGFDTWANVYESQALAAFIDAIPAGRIVAVATQDDAGLFLTTEAVAALGTLGAKADLRGASGKVHALIGVKGAAPGTAAELVADGSAYLHVGSNPDERTLAAAVDFVTFERK